MALLWRYLLFHYFKVLSFCCVAFIALLLTLRLEEIAHFATLGSQGLYIALFILYQIPYILPIALPISALISAMILTQKLSKNQELTALRAAGFSLTEILMPLLFGAFMLGMANFYVVSELATSSHLSTSLIKNELRCINPLLLVSNKHLMKHRGIYFDTFGPSRMGESACDIVIALPSKNHKRLNLLVADDVRLSPLHFDSQYVTLISSLNESDHPSELLIENIEKSSTTLEDFAQIIQKKVWTLNNDHLKLSLLLARLDEESVIMQQALLEEHPQSEIKQIQRNKNRVYSEMIRRLSVALALVSFTLLGACAGIHIGRQPSRKGVIFVMIFSALYLSAYFSAKGIDHLLVTSALFYLAPHFLMIAVALWMLRRTAQGIE